MGAGGKLMAVKWQGAAPIIQFTHEYTPVEQAGLLTGETQLTYKRKFRKLWTQFRDSDVSRRDFYRTGYVFWRSELAKVDQGNGNRRNN
jgi:hypothetical protein